MSSFRYGMSGGSWELIAYSEEGAGAAFAFPKETSGEIYLGSHSYPLKQGRVSITAAGLADGVYTPHLLSKDKKMALPAIRKCGNKITFIGYTTPELCEKFDEVRRLKRVCRELGEKYKALEEYVFGKGLF